MQEIFDHSQKYKYNWGEEIKNYETKKNELGWKVSEPPIRITHKLVKQTEEVFNPIMQIYKDKAYDLELKKKEEQNVINEIIKNQDNQLKIEQTYNIINLRDRLKGFENHPDYPIDKNLLNKRKQIVVHPKNYNIVSNLSLQEHYFDKPENRPNYEKSQPPKKKTVYNFGYNRDYDIISTNYKVFNKEKREVDNEIKKLQAAKLFYKKNDYNPIKGAYFNKVKEEEFLKKREEMQKNWGLSKIENMPKCAKGKSDIYNLINLSVVDKKEMDKMIQTEKDKKQRYEVRYEMEKYYRKKCIENSFKNSSVGKTYAPKTDIHNRTTITNINENVKGIFTKRQEHNDWERLISGSNQHSTFGSKKIYKDMYDYSDSGCGYNKYKLQRSKTLNELPSVSEDPLFKKVINTKDNKNENLKVLSQTKTIGISKNLMSKEKFFKEIPNNINLSKGGHEILYRNKMMVGSRDEFEANKELNMRNTKKSIQCL